MTQKQSQADLKVAILELVEAAEQYILHGKVRQEELIRALQVVRGIPGLRADSSTRVSGEGVLLPRFVSRGNPGEEEEAPTE